jgi:DNA-binding response OmpR family regulator
MKRALLIETSSPRRTACAEYLQARGVDTYTARGLSDARALLPALKPDVTALDPDLEDGDGLELIKEIIDRGSRCLILSAREEVEYRIRALSLGADDYLLQPVHLEELFLRLRNILANRPPLESGFKSAIVDLQGVKVDLVSRALLNRDGARGPELTETELSLLRILTDNVNRIVSKETLFATVYGRSYSPGTRSLDVGISRLRIKLKSTDNGAEIRSVREAGYLLSREIEAAHTKTPTYRHAEI